MDLVDNAALREAIKRFAESANEVTYRDVLRECLQGNLLLDATGSEIRMTEDGTSMAAGSTLTFAGGSGPDGNKALFAFTRQEEAQKLHDDIAATTVGQPSIGVLEMVGRQESRWLYIDPAGPTCAVPSADIRHAMRAPMNVEVKAALGVQDVLAQKTAVLDALALGGVLLRAVRTEPSGQAQVRTSQSADGKSNLLAFTSELEVAARFDTFEFVVTPVAEVVDSVLSKQFSGLVLNPAGPWIGLEARDLRDVRKSLERKNS